MLVGLCLAHGVVHMCVVVLEARAHGAPVLGGIVITYADLSHQVEVGIAQHSRWLTCGIGPLGVAEP